jgi:hypothetical protein
MPSLFKNSVVLKAKNEEIVAKLLLIPMWHLQATYFSIGLILVKPCADAINALWYPILLPTGAKWSLLHQVLVSRFSLALRSHNLLQTRHIKY